jgi:methyltransferase (TIGR00027 family)
MEHDRPSSTADGAALMRAVHRVLDRPRILDDPFAALLIGPERKAALQGDPSVFDTPELRRLRASIAVRSRYAEDCLADAVRRGTRQYVILGAGLDSFAYRNPFTAEGLHVYEVDHPNTQAWKRERLAAAGVELPASLTFVAIDFERETIPHAMRRSGFDAGAATFVSWLGVTVYLARDAVLRTLAWVTSLGAGSEIVFSFVTTPAPERAAAAPALSSLAARAAAQGEPWVTFFDPADLVRELEQLGFAEIEDFGAPQAVARYYGGRRDGLRPGGLGHLMRARTKG